MWKPLTKSVTFSKIAGLNTPLCVFFMFFKCYKWYQIAQSVSNSDVIKLSFSSSLFGLFWNQIFYN